MSFVCLWQAILCFALVGWPAGSAYAADRPGTGAANRLIGPVPVVLRDDPNRTVTPGKTAAASSIDSSRDSRLVRKIDMGVKNVAFSDLCHDLTAKTSIAFSADASVADDKITLYCTNRPLDDVLRQIAEQFDFEWQRDGPASEFRYRLSQSAEARQNEALERLKEDSAGLALMDREMQQYRPYLGLTIDRLDAMRSAAVGAEKDRIRVFRYREMAPANLYAGLSAEARAALAQGATLRFGSRGGGESALPAIVEQYLIDLFNSNTTVSFENGRNVSDGRRQSIRTSPDTNWLATLSLVHDRTGRYAFKGRASVTVPSLGIDDELNRYGESLAPTVEAELDNAAMNKSLADLPEMRKPLTLDIEPTGWIDSWVRLDDRVVPTGPLLMAGDFEQAIHTATGRDIIGDSFAGAYGPRMLNAKDTPLFDVLCRDCDRMHVRWSRQNGFLRFRSVRYYRQRVLEVPNRQLERWATLRRSRGALTGDEIADIGRLTDAQLDSTAVLASAVGFYGLKEWALVLNPALRPHWQFLGALPAAQRQLAFSQPGLPSAKLPMKLEQRFRELAWTSPVALRQATYRDLGRANLRVEYIMPPAAEPGAVNKDPSAASAERPGRSNSLRSQPGPPIHWRVKFTYTYGGADGGRWRRTIEPNRMSTGEPGTFKE